MTRIWSVVGGAILLIAFMATYLELARRARPEPPRLVERPVATGVTIELTPTFGVAPSGWGLGGDRTFEVRCEGRTIFSSEVVSAPGETIRFEGVDALSVGDNEVWCVAYAGPDAAVLDDRLDFGTGRSPNVNSHGAVRGLRVRIGRGGQWWADQTLWSFPGAAPAGVVRVRIPSGMSEAAQAPPPADPPVSLHARPRANHSARATRFGHWDGCSPVMTCAGRVDCEGLA